MTPSTKLFTAAAALMIVTGAANAYDFSSCQEIKTEAGRGQCCSGAIDWAVAEKVFHQNPQSHVEASRLAFSTKAGRRALVKFSKECMRAR